MNVDLRSSGADYLAFRRARGYGLVEHGPLIASFLDGLATRGVTTIRVIDALAFATARPENSASRQAKRLHVIRGLAAFVHALDPAAAELIPTRLIVARTMRRIPYLYSIEQTEMLMSKAAALSPRRFAASMHTLIGLMACTGIRSGEAVALDVDDFDVERQTLTVTGKFERQRLVPLHSSSIEALSNYLATPGQRPASTGPLLLAAKGGRLDARTARIAFRNLVNECRLVERPGNPTPRLHDFRHSFAVASLIEAHRQGVDIDARVAALATYLGHVNPANTYWYLTASPELMAVVSDRMDLYRRGGLR